MTFYSGGSLLGTWLVLGVDTASPGVRGGTGRAIQGAAALPCGGDRTRWAFQVEEEGV